MRRSLSALAFALTVAALVQPARAACDVKGAQIEETIARTSALRADANAQTVRDLRTLRDAAIVLDTYKFPGECEVLLGIAKSMLKNPTETIEQGGDTDEDKAESLVEVRKPKSTAGTAPGAPEIEPNPKTK